MCISKKNIYFFLFCIGASFVTFRNLQFFIKNASERNFIYEIEIQNG